MSPITLLRPNAGRPARVWTPLSRDYWRLKKNTYRANLAGYWPLWEPTGATCIDLAHLRNGTAVGVTRGATGIGDGNLATTFDDDTDRVNIYSAELAGDFNGAEITAEGWAQASGAGVWTDGTYRYLLNLGADGNNYLLVLKSSTNNRLYSYIVSGGSLVAITQYDTGGPLTWFHWAVTVSESADEYRFYFNGTQRGATKTGLGTWAGSLASDRALIGNAGPVPGAAWIGNMQHVSIYNAPLPDQVIKRLARAN